MKPVLLFAAILTIGIATISVAAPADPQLGQLKKQVRDLRSDKAALQDTVRSLRLDKADLNVQIDAQDDLIESQADTVTRLRTRIANTPDPLDAVTARDADGLWQAMRAIWLAFPANDPATFCGYDKSASPGDPDGLSVTVYSFLRTTGC